MDGFSAESMALPAFYEPHHAFAQDEQGISTAILARQRVAT
jgi:hypothetical protein